MPERKQPLSGGADIHLWYDQQGKILADEERQGAIDRFVPYEPFQLDPPKPERPDNN